MREYHNEKRNKNLLWSLLAAAATVLFYGLWQLVRYGQRLWRQPRLAQILPGIETDETELLRSKGQAIAIDNLRSGLEQRPLANGETKTILCAGVRNFREPWARDFGFASLGLLALDEISAVRDGLDVFFTFQNESGQFPVKVHATNIIDRYLHSLFGREQPITTPLRPKYITAHNTISLDGNCLLIIAALHYAQHIDEPDFLAQNWPKLERALGWLAEHKHADDGLLHQSAFTDWADSVGRTGRVLYTNVLYWKAVHEMAAAAQQLGYHDAAADYSNQANALATAVQIYFWRDDLGYFVTSQEYTFLSSSGNLLAIAWELASDEQAQTILDAMDRFGMADPVPTQVTHLPYPKATIALENRLAGIPEYHTHAAWLWLGAWHVIALVKAGRHQQAQKTLDRIYRVVVRDGVVHEVYGRNGRYLSTTWYTSEAPLTWNAGMLVYARHILDNATQPEPQP